MGLLCSAISDAESKAYDEWITKMSRAFRGRKSRRQTIEEINATFRFNAMMRGGTPEQMAQAEKFCTPLPPLRHRVKRPVDQQPVAPLEKDIQRTILDALALRKDVVFVGRFNRGQAVATNNYGEQRYTPFNSVPGFPDIHGLLLGGRAFYIEVKRPPPHYEKPSEKQQRFLDEARVGGAAAGVATSVEEAMAILA